MKFGTSGRWVRTQTWADFTSTLVQLLLCVHILLLSSNQERHLWSPKYINFHMFVCDFHPEISSFFGKSFPSFFFFLLFIMLLLMMSCGAIITVCSHTFTLFWLRKASVISVIYHSSFRVTFIQRSHYFSIRVFPFFSYLLYVIDLIPGISTAFCVIWSGVGFQPALRGQLYIWLRKSNTNRPDIV